MPNYYDSEAMDNDASSPSEAESDESMDKSKSKEKDMPTALIPKSLLAGKDFKPGEEVVFKIVHMYDDEVEIAYSYEHKEEEEDESMENDSDEMKSSMNQLESSYD